MLHNTRGIVLKQVKYGETSIISTVFTEEFGIQSYVINGIRSARSKKNIIDFAPMSLLEMVVYKKPGRDIQRISDWKRVSHQSEILTDIRKSSVAIFLSEVLFRSLRESEPFPELFGFIFHSMEWLENSEDGSPNFHLQFIVKLSRYLGFGLDHYGSEPGMGQLQELGKLKYGDSYTLKREQRRELLERILLYFREHIDGFGQVRSLTILQEVFDE